MLTLLKNIERFNKRYNKKRGSAMLMVLMTMAIIIVVGTSMLFVTLSSFLEQHCGHPAGTRVQRRTRNDRNAEKLLISRQTYRKQFL